MGRLEVEVNLDWIYLAETGASTRQKARLDLAYRRQSAFG